MENSFQDIKKLIEYPRGGILSKEVLKDGRYNATLFCLAAGTEISEHAATKDGFIYVLEGEGVFHLDGKDIIMQEGVLIAMRANAAHSLRAKADTSFLLLLVGGRE